MKMNVETKAVYEKYGVSMTGGCLQLVIQLPILLALYQVIYHIPAYVNSVGSVFYDITDKLLGTVGGTAILEVGMDPHRGRQPSDAGRPAE